MMTSDASASGDIMTTFVLVPGAGGVGWYWHRVVADLESRGHDAVAVDIREDDPALGLPEYAGIVEAAIDGRPDVVLVAQSLAGFTAPVVAARRPLRMLVLVNAMIPLPGERPAQWWDATGQEPARRAAALAAGRGPDFDLERDFLHDVAPEVAAAGAHLQRAPADTPFGQPCEFERWPDIPIKVVVGRDDRFFPASFQRRVARERLGLDVDEIPGGHLVALSNPKGLVDLLLS
jgi:pimeloyl-ACP methyl ester carboxylesterase